MENGSCVLSNYANVSSGFRWFHTEYAQYAKLFVGWSVRCMPGREGDMGSAVVSPATLAELALRIAW